MTNTELATVPGREELLKIISCEKPLDVESSEQAQYAIAQDILNPTHAGGCVRIVQVDRHRDYQDKPIEIRSFPIRPARGAKAGRKASLTLEPYTNKRPWYSVLPASRRRKPTCQGCRPLCLVSAWTQRPVRQVVPAQFSAGRRVGAGEQHSEPPVDLPGFARLCPATLERRTVECAASAPAAQQT
jgi:hypothetical protein